MIVKFKRFNLELDDDLAWLEPYVRLAKDRGIPISRLKAIRGYYIPKSRVERQSAQCEMKDGTYIISILKKVQLYSPGKNGKFEVSKYIDSDQSYQFEDTLDTLAHELSHLRFWNHSANRMILEKKLQLAFARLAKKLKYKGYK